jgi:hypothetical protein
MILETQLNKKSDEVIIKNNNQLFHDHYKDKDDNVYVIDYNNSNNNINYIIKGSAKSRKRSSTANQDEIISLHNRWGHPSIDKMKNGLRLKSVVGSNTTYSNIKDYEMPVCMTCLKGRMKVDTTTKSETDKSNIENLQIICTDIKGPLPKYSIHKNKWFILFVCAKTNFMAVYFMKDKTETLEKLKLFKLEYPDMFGYKMKTLQCDQDKMFTENELKKWCVKNGVNLQTSPPYHHASNGLAERAIQTVMDKTRTIMSQNDAPEGYWEEAVDTAIYLLNRTPVRKLNWKTPYEEIYKQVPDISHLVPFYSKGAYHLTKEERKNTLSPKAIECRMIGYNKYGKNQYKILLPFNKILNRRDVVFDEIVKEKEVEEVSTDEGFKFSKREASPVKSDYNLRDVKNKNVKNFNRDKNENIYMNYVYDSDEEFVHQSDELEIYIVPKNLQEALESKDKEKWITAIEKELAELDERGVFEYIDEDNDDGHGMKSKLFYKVKFGQNLEIVFKARLVACGYSQIFGIDYFDTYSPTTTTITFNIIITICYINGWFIIGIDISNAFLEGDIDVPNYMYLPKDLVLFLTGDNKKKIRVKLNKSLYGIKQAPKIFNEKLNNQLLSVGFKRLSADVCLYIKTIDNDNYYLIVHIDDIIITGRDNMIIEQLFDEIGKGFKRITRGKEFKRYLGINFEIRDNKIKLNQKTYIESFLSEYFEDIKIGNSYIPMSTNIKYKTLEIDKNNKSILPITGKIRYCADKSRPDILYTINTISTQASNPNEEYINATIKLLKYLNTTIDSALTLGGNDKEVKLFAYSDASYITEGDSKSQLGNCFLLTKDSGAIYSISKKDNTVSHSSTEAEIEAIDLCVRTVIYLRNLLKEIKFEQVIENDFRNIKDNTQYKTY